MMEKLARPGALAMIVLAISASVIGLAPILVRLADVGPAAAGFWRFALALPLLLMLMLTWRRAPEQQERGPGLPQRWMVVAGLFFVADLAFWHYSIRMTSVVNATVLCNLTPVVVTLFAWVMFRERPGASFMAALAMAIFGASMMAFGARGAGEPGQLAGDLLALSVALWYGGYFLAVKAARRHASTMRVMFWATAIGAPPLLLIGALLGETLIPLTLFGWLVAAGLGLMHVVGQGGVAWALGRLPAAAVSMVVLVQPVVAAALSWWLFGEAMTPLQGLGAVLVLVAVVMAQRAPVRKLSGAGAP